MQIVTCCFDYEDRPQFRQLLDVFRHSVKRLMPNVDFVELRPDPPPVEGHRVHGFLDNTFKLDAWVKHLDNTDQPVIFADCDMLALQSAEHAPREPNDSGTYTPEGFWLRVSAMPLLFRHQGDQLFAVYPESDGMGTRFLEPIQRKVCPPVMPDSGQLDADGFEPPLTCHPTALSVSAKFLRVDGAHIGSAGLEPARKPPFSEEPDG